MDIRMRGDGLLDGDSLSHTVLSGFLIYKDVRTLAVVLNHSTAQHTEPYTSSQA